MPVQCQQCKNPPCVKVCPVHATWQETDGITVIDYDWCIGCRYCEAACPYWARRFQFHQAFDSERPDQSGHGLPRQPSAATGRDGEMPLLHPAHPGWAAILPASRSVPSGARKFGNILDPDSEVSYILRNKRVFIQLKEELGTSPTVLLLLRRMIDRPSGIIWSFSGAARASRSCGDWRYYTWVGALAVFCLLGLNAYCQAVRPRPGRHGHERRGFLGRLYRQLHLPRRRGGGGGDDGHSRLHL